MHERMFVATSTQASSEHSGGTAMQRHACCDAKNKLFDDIVRKSSSTPSIC
jgi:hypothetical protein